MRPSGHPRAWGIVVLAACALLAASACGSGSPVSPRAATEGPAPTVTVPFEMPVVISVAGFFDEQTLAILYDQIAAFEEAEPGVRVELLAASRDAGRRQEEFAASLAAGETSIDIYVVSPHWLAGYAGQGGLRPLDVELPAAGVDMDAFLPAAVEASTIDGRLMALPWSVDGGLLYYRRDLLEAGGYGPPATWREVEAMALELRSAGGPAHGFVWQGAEVDALTCNTLEQIWAAGGDVLDAGGQVVVDGDAVRAALEQMTRFLAGGASPVEVVDYQEAAALADFRSGNAVFMRNWSYAWQRLQEPDSPVRGQVGVAPLPASCLGGQSLVLSASTIFPEQALRFMAFLVAPAQQAQLALEGVQAPARGEILRDPGILAREPYLADLYLALAAARPRPQVADYPRFSAVIYSEVHRLLQGDQDVDSTARNLQARLEALLAE
jgi:ABC-type glycerol-3-phosphate transport system substrate-binding protein